MPCHHQVLDQATPVTPAGSETSFLLPAHLPSVLLSRARQDVEVARRFGVARFATMAAATAAAEAVNRGGILPDGLVHASIAGFYWLEIAEKCQKANRSLARCLVSKHERSIEAAGGILNCPQHGTVPPGMPACDVCNVPGQRLMDVVLPMPDLSAWNGVHVPEPVPPIWVGNDYWNGGQFGKRVVIVSESTYGAPATKTFYYNVMMAHDHINQFEDGHRQRLSKAFIGHKPNRQEIARFWHSVVFFNYVLEPLPNCGMAPQNWHGQPIESWLEFLRPQLVVLTNFRMWDKKGHDAVIPWPFQPGSVPLSGAVVRHSRYYESPTGHRFHACAMKQPAYCGPSAEHDVLTRALEAAPDLILE